MSHDAILYSPLKYYTPKDFEELSIAYDMNTFSIFESPYTFYEEYL